MAREKNPTNPETLEDLYVTQKRSIRDIAKILEISSTLVRKRLIKYGILRRKNNEHYHDILGQKFGDLEVIELLGSCPIAKRKLWLCQCICGEEISTYSDRLLRGSTTTCGCGGKRVGNQHKSWRGHGELGLHFWNIIKKGAEVRDLEFSITIEEAWELFEKQDRKCALSGIKIIMPYGKLALRDYLHTASLDRIDSTKGYTIDNIQWVDKYINRMKNMFSQDFFIKMCKLVAKNNKGKK